VSSQLSGGPGGTEQDDWGTDFFGCQRIVEPRADAI